MNGGVFNASFCPNSIPSQTRESMVILDTGASANLVGTRWLQRHDDILREMGWPRVRRFKASARFKFGDGRVGTVTQAAFVPISIAGHTGELMAYIVEADIPALLGKAALECLGGTLDFGRNLLSLPRLHVDIPLRTTDVGHYLMNILDAT